MSPQPSVSPVDETWAGQFTDEMRLRGASGAEIGDALAVVETHCRESGEKADDAFGRPRAYAASLHPQSPTHVWNSAIHNGLATSAGLIGWAVADRQAVHPSTPLNPSWSDVVIAGLVLVAFPTLPALVRHRSRAWNVAAWIALPLVAIIASATLGNHPTGVRVPPAVGWSFSTVLAVVSSYSLWRVGRDQVKEPDAEPSSWIRTGVVPLIPLLAVGLTMATSYLATH